MLAERRMSSERLRQMEQQAQQLAIAHESLDKAKAELVALRMERDSTVCVVFSCVSSHVGAGVCAGHGCVAMVLAVQHRFSLFMANSCYAICFCFYICF